MTSASSHVRVGPGSSAPAGSAPACTSSGAEHDVLGVGQAGHGAKSRL